MSVVRVKIDICEYYFEYETLEDIKNHFKKNDTSYIGLDIIDNYGGKSKGEKVLIDQLTLEHVQWTKKSCDWGSKYLWGRKN